MVVLSDDGVRYREDGSRGKAEQASDWVARLEITGEAVLGNPILPSGEAQRESVTLDLREWEQVLKPGDPVLHLHIPGDGPMTWEACQESFWQALEFFPKHYPDYHFRAFMCGSWILNNWFAEVLPGDSNLVRFQRGVHLFPIPMRAADTYWRVFGEYELPADLSTLPRRSSLQRAIAEALEAGRDADWRAGGVCSCPKTSGEGPRSIGERGLRTSCPSTSSARDILQGRSSNRRKRCW